MKLLYLLFIQMPSWVAARVLHHAGRRAGCSALLAPPSSPARSRPFPQPPRFAAAPGSGSCPTGRIPWRGHHRHPWAFRSHLSIRITYPGVRWGVGLAMVRSVCPGPSGSSQGRRPRPAPTLPAARRAIRRAKSPPCGSRERQPSATPARGSLPPFLKPSSSSPSKVGCTIAAPRLCGVTPESSKACPEIPSGSCEGNQVNASCYWARNGIFSPSPCVRAVLLVRPRGCLRRAPGRRCCPSEVCLSSQPPFLTVKENWFFLHERVGDSLPSRHAASPYHPKKSSCVMSIAYDARSTPDQARWDGSVPRFIVTAMMKNNFKISVPGYLLLPF